MPKKQYGDTPSYEAKLARVMERLGVKEYDYNFDRQLLDTIPVPAMTKEKASRPRLGCGNL